jgi:hypothetical protein
MNFPVVRLTLALIACAFVVEGCANAKAIEGRKPSKTQAFASVQAVGDNSDTGVPRKITTEFQLQLNEALYDESKFRRGNDLTIRWKITSAEEGSRTARYWAGLFGAGKGKIVVSAKFFDRKGQEVGAIQSEGNISMCAFGGSYTSAMAVCADEIAKYARQNFLARRH